MAKLERNALGFPSLISDQSPLLNHLAGLPAIRRGTMSCEKPLTR